MRNPHGPAACCLLGCLSTVKNRGRAQQRMSGEGQLLFHGEDAGGGPGGRDIRQENGLELPHFLRHALHRSGGPGASVHKHRQTIAGQRPGRKHIDMKIIRTAHSRLLRHSLGGVPTTFLNARLKAASES